MTEKQAGRKSKTVSTKLTSRKKALLAAEAGLSNKAAEPVIMKVGDLIDYTDYFVVMHGESTVQVMAIVDVIAAMIASSPFE